MAMARVLVRSLAVAVLCMGAGSVDAGNTDVNSAASLRARYLELKDQLANNPFRRPLHLDSSVVPGGVTGSIHALVDFPLATVEAALSTAENWCDILILHLNTKYCRASDALRGNSLDLAVGRIHHQPLDETYRVEFVFRVTVRTPDYLQVRLNAEEGPLDTSDFRIVLEAVAMEDRRTFMHFSYSYAYGTVGRLAMQAYLGTVGRNKVGFTVIDAPSGVQPVYVGGMRGVAERNTMRYFLAIEAFLGALSAPPQARLEKRLNDWFAAIERYPRQLHEMEQGEYLEMKRKEYSRQRAGPSATMGLAPAD